ncbi:MAG: hypothetical protein ACLQBX_03590 [Candidatus Limnocylindrales bacterium]
MTAIHLVLEPSKGEEPTFLVAVEFQYMFRDAPKDLERERWVVGDARQWAAGSSVAEIAREAAALTKQAGGHLVYDRSGPGETFYDLFAVAKQRASGVILTAGQLPSDVGLPKVVVVRRFESKLSSGRVAVGDFPLAAVLRAQLAKFASNFKLRGVQEDQDGLLLAAMIGVRYRKCGTGWPQYLARNGKLYPSRKLSPDVY